MTVTTRGNPPDLLVFTHHPNAYAPIRLVTEAQKLGLSSQIINYDEVNLEKLPEANFVILREPDTEKCIYHIRDRVLGYYKSRGARILNQDSYTKWSVLDKLTQHQEFERGWIPHLKLLKISEAIFPFVAKSKLGSHGNQVFKVNSRADLDTVLANYNPKDLLIQEFQTAGFDLRVIVLCGKFLGIMKRTPKEGGFLSNYSQGGEIAKYLGKNSEEMKRIENLAMETANLFKLDFAGVDLMMGNDGAWKVLEVNRACQFEGFEKAVGANVPDAILRSLGITSKNPV